MSMKEKKKVYVKPTITVAEWDFNEAVCDDWIMQLSDTRCIKVDPGTYDAHYSIETTDNPNQWQDWPPSR